MEKLKYFHNENYLLIYNVETLQLIKFRSGLKSILPKILPEDYSNAEKNAFYNKINNVNDLNFKIYLQQIFETNSFNFDETETDAEKETITISFAPTHKCNLKCKYCFAESGENYKNKKKNMDINTLDKIFKFIFDIYAPKCKNIQISLVGGGEPFLNLEICKYLNESIEHYKKCVNKKLFIATNGTLYDNNIKNDLISINPQLGISIDGNRINHNKFRIYQNSQGTYDDIISNMAKIQSDKDLSKKTRNFTFMTVLTTENLNLVELLKHHRNLGATSVQIKIVRSNDEKISINEKNLYLFKNAYKELSDFLIEEFASKKMEYLYMITNKSDYFGKFIKSLLLSQPNIFRCGAGRDRLSFTADGNIFPCDNFVGNNKFLLGSVFDEFNANLYKKFNQLSINKLETCSSCWIRYLCSGDCCFNSFVRTGDISTPDPVMCDLFKFLGELSIRLVTTLDDIDRNQFKSFKRLISIREKNNFIH